MSETVSLAHWQQQPLPWQAAALDQLALRREQNQLPHALLISGAEGLGKARFAESLASLLLCASPRNYRACGHCGACQVAQGGGHGDYRWLAPAPDKRAIGIDAVRAMLGFIQQTSGYGSHKVLAIAPAEAMTTAAANALLKTLEEPAGNSALLLVSHRPSDLPATVRSRCQQVVLPTPTLEASLRWLQDELTGTDAAATGIPQETLISALAAASHRPLAAFDLIVSGNLEAVQTRAQLIRGLLTAHVSAAEASAALASEPPEAMLSALYQSLSQRLASASAAELAQFGPKSFVASDAIVNMLAAVRAGVNPAKDILYAEACRHVAGLWSER